MKKKNTEAIVIAAILCVVIVVGIIGVIKVVEYNMNPIVMFDKLIAKIDRISAINSDSLASRDAEKDSLEDEIDDLLDALKVSHYDDARMAINKDFVDKYLEKHTKEEFLDSVIKIYIFSRNKNAFSSYRGSIRDESWHTIDEMDCQCQRLTELLTLAFQINNIEINGINSSMAGQSGYYTENPDAEPHAFEEPHSGSFYDRDGTNGRWETKTDTGTVTYYGDYAILSVVRYQYYQGRYGWQNGIFYDELPSWKTIQFAKLYYKGEFIQEADNAWEFLNGKSCVMDINGVRYEIGQFRVDTDTVTGYADTHTFMDMRRYQ
jgi:hypothetical protein